MNQPRSLAASLLSLALTVLAACWAINWAAHLLLAVWPVVLVATALVVVVPVTWRYFQSRDFW